jgi:hypothetical protein
MLMTARTVQGMARVRSGAGSRLTLVFCLECSQRQGQPWTSRVRSPGNSHLYSLPCGLGRLRLQSGRAAETQASVDTDERECQRVACAGAFKLAW